MVFENGTFNFTTSVALAYKVGRIGEEAEIEIRQLANPYSPTEN